MSEPSAVMDIETLEINIADLREREGDRLDPMRLHFIEAMLCRARERGDAAAASVILHRAHRALQAYRAELRISPDNDQKAPDQSRQASALLELTALLNRASDEAAGVSELEELLRQQERELLHGFSQAQDGCPPALPELKSAHRFQSALRQIGVDRRVARATIDAHEDAGPLNPQMLVTESLSQMKDLSPAYLGRFVTYFDTLFWLQGADRENR